jgi:hypothetical protein
MCEKPGPASQVSWSSFPKVRRGLLDTQWEGVSVQSLNAGKNRTWKESGYLTVHPSPKLGSILQLVAREEDNSTWSGAQVNLSSNPARSILHTTRYLGKFKRSRGGGRNFRYVVFCHRTRSPSFTYSFTASIWNSTRMVQP